MLSAGDRAPGFRLPDASGRLVALDELLADGPAILYFYPSDFTLVCTRQACMVRDTGAALATAGLSIAGISPNPPEKHARFAERYGLRQRLLSDTDKRVIDAYGVRGPLGFGLRRATFLICADGRIVDTVSAAFNVGRHEAFVHRAAELVAGSRRR